MDENMNENVPVEPVAPENPHPVKSANTVKVIITSVLCTLLVVSLVVAILLWSGVFESSDDPEATEPSVAETTEPSTTEPLNLKSYTADFETAQAKADDVVATAGDAKLTNGQLQVYYWMGIYEFISQNSYLLPYMGVDFTQPLDQQVYNPETNQTWQEAMLDYALQRWHQYESVRQYAVSTGYEESDDVKNYEATLDETIKTMLEQANYASVQEMLDKEMGAGATEAGYRSYMIAGNYAVSYMTAMRETLTLTDEELEQYFTDNQEALTEAGITKEAGDAVDVRHILVEIAGGTENEDGTKTYSDEDWETCRQAAQEIYDAWKAGKATEESFGELAKEKTQDPGSKSTGGLYTGVQQGKMVEEFDAWIFDESRKTGDTDMVKTSFGYHIMFFVGKEPIWKSQCLNQYQMEKLDGIIVAALEAAPMDVNYDAIVLGQAKTE